VFTIVWGENATKNKRRRFFRKTRRPWRKGEWEASSRDLKQNNAKHMWVVCQLTPWAT